MSTYWLIENFLNQHVNPYVAIIAIIGFIIQINQFRKLKKTAETHQNAVNKTISFTKEQLLHDHLSNIKNYFDYLFKCIQNKEFEAARFACLIILEKLIHSKHYYPTKLEQVQMLIDKINTIKDMIDQKVINKKYDFDFSLMAKIINEIQLKILELTNPISRLEES
ncbi:hypothetical protein [Geothrix paludis]|uniref:hypothetical protein n=1 Tax=Geothrix paludis TaxID=2922722 RepID=UPI001FAC9EB9|nr:hypothetical protein [Geothrix paludis]